MVTPLSPNPVNESKCLFLHLSDIHFSKQQHDPYDLDEDLRRQLVQDAERVVKELGNVTAILVTGDIAYSATEYQFEVAASWLDTLAETVRCHPKIVLVTPGNHDVDRSYYDNDPDLRTYHNQLRRCQPHEIDGILAGLFSDETTRSKLYEPLKNYNQFAAAFGCDINFERPCWERILELGNAVTLRFRGLNSVLTSNVNDDSDPRRLSLGLHQVQIDDADQRIIHVTLCHHPPDWLIDYDAVHAYLSGRVHLQLFGHKHSQMVDTVNDRIRITAGAVHPSRAEMNWLPRYNFIQVWSSCDNDIHKVHFRIYSRIWKGTRFGPDHSDAGEEYEEFTYTIGRGLAASSGFDMVRAPSSNSDVPIISVSEQIETALEETITIIGCDDISSMIEHRDFAPVLVRRFLNLGVYDRRTIIDELDLASDEERRLGDQRLLKLVFERAKNRKLLEKLWDRVEAIHNDGLYDKNPFAGR